MKSVLKFAVIAARAIPTLAQALSFAPLINPSEKCLKVYNRYISKVSRSWDLRNELVQFGAVEELSERNLRRIAKLERKSAHLDARAQHIRGRVDKYCEGSL